MSIRSEHMHMTAWSRVCVILAVALAVGETAGAQSRHTGGGRTCPALETGAEHLRSVDSALRAGHDLWGAALRASAGGPTFAGARGYVQPLLFARAPGGKPLTHSGFHYLAFDQPTAVDGSGTPALHVADGSQILSKRTTGRSLTIGVGPGGRERYGSCLARLTLPELAGGYLPILETRYADSAGARYAQESFAARVSETALVSFVRLTADAHHVLGDVEVRFTPSDEATVTLELPRRAVRTAYVAWSATSSGSHLHVVDKESYEAARESVKRYWLSRLSEGATIDVPERQVQDASRNLLIQNLGLTWRYSVGNPYQQFSYPEGVDVAQVLSSYGFSGVARSVLRRSLDTPRGPYGNWRLGQKLVGAALHYRLFRDRAVVDELTPALRAGVESLGRQIASERPGLLRRERYSSDVPDLVYGLHSQAVAWQGLREMGRVWREMGRDTLAAKCRTLAAGLESALRRAVHRSQQRLQDGSLFVPVRLLEREQPYDFVTSSRSGSYWNLVMPYALASGLLPPGSAEARGVLRYLNRHGSRLLGLVRAGAYSLYGRSPRYPASGVNPVYGLNVARFLADNDRPDQLVLSLYGQLAAGMAPGTFVAGEAASIAPLSGEYYRSMYLPPNGASNGSFLETLRLMLVHETRKRAGAPSGLELAFGTPRHWLEPGKEIAVRNLPTSFGPITFSIESHRGRIRASVDVPARSRVPRLELRLRLPAGKRIARVVVDGRPWMRFDTRAQTIDLSGRTGRVDLSVVIEQD